jgi:hypothetical protein
VLARCSFTLAGESVKLEDLGVGRDVDSLDGFELEFVSFTPSEEPANGIGLRRLRVQVSDLGREEPDEAVEARAPTRTAHARLT